MNEDKQENSAGAGPEAPLNFVTNIQNEGSRLDTEGEGNGQQDMDGFYKQLQGQEEGDEGSSGEDERDSNQKDAEKFLDKLNEKKKSRFSMTQRASMAFISLKNQGKKLTNLMPKTFDIENLMEYKEAALMENEQNAESVKRFQDDDELSTFSQILDELQYMENKRQKQPRELYEGRRSCRKKTFFYLQTFYPFFQNLVFVFLMFTFANQLIGQDAYKLFLMADWKNDVSYLSSYSREADLNSMNDGFNNTTPTTNFLVLDASAKECPEGWTEFLD